MPRTLTTAMRTKLGRSDDIGLVTIVKIAWGVSDDTYHGDRSFAYSSVTVLPNLYGISEITYRKASFKSVIVGTCNVQICDIDKTYFNKLKTTRLVKAQATIYLHLEGLTAPTDFVELFAGDILTPVRYDEVTRILSFDVVPPFAESEQFPFSATEEGTTQADIKTDEQYYGAGYPTPFGRVVDIPCQLVNAPTVTKLATGIDESNGISFFVDTEPYDDTNPYTNPTVSNPYLIGEERVTGLFGTGTNAKRFTVSARNAVKATVGSTTRPTLAADPDRSLANVLYLTSSTQVVGHWMQMTQGNGTDNPRNPVFYNYCYKQIANKCWFLYNWASTAGSNQLIGSGCTFTVRKYSSTTGTRWTHEPGTEVRRINPKHVYVFSDTPIAATTDVVRVRAYRQVPVIGGQPGQTYRQLVQVPSGYYTLTRNDANFAHALENRASHAANTIEFSPPLRERYQGWEDDVVYVSLTTNFYGGTVNDERNPARQIEYILNNYTEFTPDATSFAAVAAQIGGFDADYCMASPQDAFQACADIAWQARCGLIVVGRTVKIKYLSVTDPGTSYEGPSLTNALACLDGDTAIEYTELEDLVTVFVAKYRETLTTDDEKRSVKRNNVTVFGEKLREFNFFIYQTKQLVNYSRDFWAGRYGNMWKLLKIRALLPAIEYEPFDFVNIAVTEVHDQLTYLLGSTTTIRGVIEEEKINDDGTVDLTLWTPIKAGATEKDSTGGWKSFTGPTSINPLSGMAVSSTDKIEAVAEENA